jgi:hypothetical protein
MFDSMEDTVLGDKCFEPIIPLIHAIYEGKLYDYGPIREQVEKAGSLAGFTTSQKRNE